MSYLRPSRRKPVRTRRNAAASRERLLRAGIRLFAARGPEATTVEMLAKAARLNRRMVYHYFGSKEGLYRAVVRRMYEESVSVEVELAHMLLPADELLDRIVRAHYGFLQTHPEFVRLLTWENLRCGRTARRIDIPSLKAPIVQALRIALDRGKREGRFRRDVDVKQVMISVMALCFFYFSNRHTVGRMLGFDLTRPHAIRKRVRHVIKLILEGIGSAVEPRKARRKEHASR